MSRPPFFLALHNGECAVGQLCAWDVSLPPAGPALPGAHLGRLRLMSLPTSQTRAVSARVCVMLEAMLSKALLEALVGRASSLARSLSISGSSPSRVKLNDFLNNTHLCKSSML